MVLDGAGWHVSGGLAVIVVLPPYSPKLDPVENERRSWKGFDRGALARLHEEANPVGAAKSVVVAEDGLRRLRDLLAEAEPVNVREKSATRTPSTAEVRLNRRHCRS